MTLTMFHRQMASTFLVGSCLDVARINLLQHKLRLVAALSGVAVALLLLILQIAVLDAVRTKITQVYDDFNFDLAILPNTYQFMLSFATFDRVLLDAARATGAVDATFGLNVDVVHWTELPSKRVAYVFLLGLDDPGSFLRDANIRTGMAALTTPHSVLIDSDSEPEMGPVEVGTMGKIGEEQMSVAGQFKLGMFFYAAGSAIVRNTEFPRLAGRDERRASIGLLRLAPGVRLEDAKSRIAKALPTDVLVFTRDELFQQERGYFLTTKPIGIMVHISMIIACLVGAVIMIQVLSTEVSTRIKEFAVLKAMGANLAYVYGIGLAQAAMLGLGGLIPAALVGSGVLWFIAIHTHLAAALTASLAFTIILITLGLAVGAGAVVMRRVQRADPAELY